MNRNNLNKIVLIQAMVCGLFVAGVCNFAWAADNNEAVEKPLPPVPTVEKSLRNQIHKIKEKHFVTVAIENDNFASGNDRNYTSGLRLSYFEIDADIPKFFHWLDPYLPSIDINNTTTIFWSLGQNLYTPQDITLRDPPADDRPYAAWLYGSAGLTTVTQNHVDEAEITLGMIGPAALGRPSQESVHDLFDLDDPSGWDTQLENEPGLVLSARRRWPRAVRKDIANLSLSLEPSLGATIGNIYTYASTGLFVRLTPTKYRFQDMPARVRPAMPGTGFFGSSDKSLSWYLFAGTEGRAIARNIFLDGNSFRDSPSVDKKHFVADLTAGIALAWHDIRISYSATYRTREFEAQDENDLFGALTVTFRY